MGGGFYNEETRSIRATSKGYDTKSASQIL